MVIVINMDYGKKKWNKDNKTWRNKRYGYKHKISERLERVYISTFLKTNFIRDG